MKKKIQPNPGPQEVFLSTSADIAIYGGKPGGGKSFGLMLEMSRHYKNPNFNGLIIRRIREDLTKIGGIWQASKDFFRSFNTKVNNSDLTHTFPDGGILGFGSLRDAKKDHERYKSVEIDVLGFEEIAGEEGNGIEEHQFWYLWGRCRGFKRSGIKSYLRGTSNPAPGWLFRFLKSGGYVGADGFAIESMSGVIRWFFRDEDTDQLKWFDSEKECLQAIHELGLNPKETKPTSFTFILASAEDNPFQDDDYMAKLSHLKRIDRERLKYGNWAIELEEGDLFKRNWWGRASRAPKLSEFKEFVRAWDIAATEKTKDNNPAYTAGVLMGVTKANRFWILNAKRFRKSPAKVREMIRATAEQDADIYGRVVTTIPLDPGAAGKLQYDTIASDLTGFIVKPMQTIGDKATRAEGLSSSVENGLVTVVIDESDPENTMDALISEGSTFPHGQFKDLIDSASDAHDYLTQRRRKKSSFASNV